MITKPHSRPFAYPIIQEYAALGLDPTKIALLNLFDISPKLYDASGNERHGTITGATWTGKGRYGQALDFDGTDDRVTFANSAGLNFGDGSTDSAFSISFYIKLNSTFAATGTVLAKHAGAGANEWRLSINDVAGVRTVGLILYDDTAGEFATFKSGITLNLSTWYQITVTYDPSLGSGATVMNGVNVYVNCVLDGSPTRTNNVAYGAMDALGASITMGELSGGAVDLDAVIDNSMIYLDTLTAGQIANLCEAGL